ncbi:hypothetical protein E3O55_04175 [Cryobacterium sp. MDB1-18-2]|uniref:hypothetical protein n=1 Tax=unclassified Cryobacterium TaxID=2649013 RepID=UPI00106C2EF0|nr:MULTISPECIES: hypothetical protein [unclassified Cryobacterium]TFC33161.1 hypothetical protein E3O55_04175 [Cryobacterium sp. MDB1-18-2]TFC37016.1 hypothetical protein E3O50_18545 [Cryobacterium sp. MDB1-18-1]
MSSEDLLFNIGALVVAYSGIVVGSVATPFMASFILDGIVQLLRGNGLKLFVLALVFTAVVAGGSFALWKFGTGNPTVTAGTLESMAVVTQYLLTFSIVFALGGFAVRMVKLLSRAR